MTTITADRAQELLDGATPGPWMLSPDTEFGEPAQQIVARGWDIATMWGGYLADNGDARLIAAAPDLARTVIAQAAEITSLQAKVDAAEKLADCLDNLLAVYSKPDARMCCDGRMCGCRGATLYDQAEHFARAALTAYKEAGK